MKALKLMIPGPVEVAPEVMEMMAEPQTPHFGADWVEFYDGTVSRLQSIFRTTGDIFPFIGSGSSGLDAAFGGTMFPDGKVLIAKNGFFGERLEHIAHSYSSNVRTLEFPLGQNLDLDQIEAALKQEQFDVMAFCHCETSSGTLHPLREIAALCQRYGVLCVVDVVSSLAIEEVDMDGWGIGISISASQKGLESPPGLSVVAVGAAGWERIQQVKSPGWYLNLKIWKEYQEKWRDWHPQPVTHAVNNLKALRAGIDRVLEEGLDNRLQRHQRITGRLRQALQELGFELFVPEAFASHAVTSIRDPRGRVEKILAHVREQHGIILAGSFGDLRGKVFRIGHIGLAATDDSITQVLDALQDALKTIH